MSVDVRNGEDGCRIEMTFGLNFHFPIKIQAMFNIINWFTIILRNF